MSKKNPIIAAADSLAAQSRILRKQAEATMPAADPTDTVVDRLAKLASEHRASEASARDAKAAEARAQYIDLIQRAERCLADNLAAVAEVGPFIRRLGGLDWKAVRARARNTSVVGSEHSTLTRLGLLQRAVEEGMELLRGDERDLISWLDKVKGFTGFEEERDRQYAVNGLVGVLSDRGVTLRAKAAAIRKILAEVTADLDAVDASLAESAADEK